MIGHFYVKTLHHIGFINDINYSSIMKFVSHIFLGLKGTKLLKSLRTEKCDKYHYKILMDNKLRKLPLCRIRDIDIYFIGIRVTPHEGYRQAEQELRIKD